LDRELAEAKVKDAPRLSVGEKGFTLTSADTNFSVSLKGLVQLDSRTFFRDAGTAGNDGFLLRRARPILQGTVFRDFDFLFVPEFGGTGSPQILDAYLNYRYSPALQLRAGKFKSPVGLEQLQSDKDTFFSERALPTGLVPNRDLGVQVHGDLFSGRVSYAAGIFNGVGDGRSSNNADFDDNKEFAGRLFFQPFITSSRKGLRGIGFGVGSSYSEAQGTNSLGLANGYTTPAQQQFFSFRSGAVAEGQHWRLAPQATYYFGPFGLLAEYTVSRQGVEIVHSGVKYHSNMENTAWQVAASWVLTGEDASFTGVTPRRPFNPKSGAWGAWQVVARYSQLSLDQDAFPNFADPAVSAHEAQEWGVGLNWYLNRNLRVNASFSHVNFEGGGGASTGTRKDENTLFTRVQLAF
jgi:phosphate-selective porin OprO/OprP